MGNILVLVQHQQGKISKASLGAIGAAFELQKVWGKGSVWALSLGPGSSQAAESVLEYAVGGSLYSEDVRLEKYFFNAYSVYLKQAFLQIEADTLVAAATTSAKDFMPRLAQQLEAAQASDILAVNSDGSLKRALYAGSVWADVELLSPIRLVTTRTTAFAAPPKTAASAQKQELKVDAEIAYMGEVVSFAASPSGRAELTDASVVISGGRGFTSKENFEQLIYPLADKLGAAVGASRAAVDAGYAPNDWQVGQTGKMVAAQLYFAVGISGSIQHIAGIKDSKVIVAINKDADAPIFEVADYGLVADLNQALPQITESVLKS